MSNRNNTFIISFYCCGENQKKKEKLVEWKHRLWEPIQMVQYTQHKLIRCQHKKASVHLQFNK